MKKFIIFDLDGTLIDTAEGIKEAANKYLLDNRYDYSYTKEEIKSFLGNGARKLFSRVLKGKDFKEEEYTLFLKYYKDYQYSSIVYKNVKDTLKYLKNSGYMLFILSNKPDELLKPLIKNLLGEIDFNEVLGQDTSYPVKPDVTMLFDKIINKYDLDTNNGYYVGDSYVDILTGKNAKLKTVFVSYGYGDKNKAIEYEPDYAISDIIRLKEILK